MLTELETANAVPRSGFVHDYIVYAMKQTTSPLAYHLGTALSILGTTCPLDYGTYYAGRLRANVFTLLVGRSGEDQKSTALGIGREVLFEAAAQLLGDFPGSPEGLIDSLARAPSQLVPISEFGRFLSSAQRGYFEPIKTLLADLWDSQSLQRAKANGKVVRVDNPRLSVLAACSVPYLEKHTLAEDWTGGFMGRWCVMYGRRERTNPDPSGDRTGFDPLVETLKRKAGVANAGWCSGLDSQATDLWRDWFNDVTNRHLPGTIVGIRARAPTMARKVAMLYGWDFGPAEIGNPWQMGLRELEPAIKFVELHIKSLVGLSEVICEHADARLRRACLDAISAFHGRASLGQILGRLKMRKRPVVETLDALLEEGRVMRLSLPEGFFYEMQAPVVMR